MARKVLITGASGLVGTRLTEILLNRGYDVAWLSRREGKGRVPCYAWNVERGTLDGEALNSVEVVVHLAGAGIADRRWTASRKREIVDSRVQSTLLLYNALKHGDHRVRCFVSASAIGYYGPADESKLFTEASPAGTDFLARVTKEWEESSQSIVSLGIRVVNVRTGIVLSDKGGVLKSMVVPTRLGFGAPLGRGNQMLSWIHIDDLCGIYVKAIEDSHLRGPYNAVGVQPVTNREMTQRIAAALQKPLWLPAVPSFVLKFALGEMASLVLTGAKVSPDKILKTGFELRFAELDDTLRELLKMEKRSIKGEKSSG